MSDTTISCPDIDGNQFEISASELHWRPSAYGVVIKDGAVLLSPQFGKYDLPGGSLDLGESLEHAVIREVKEETGIDITGPVQIGFERSFFKLPGERANQFADCLMFYYACDYQGGELSIDGFDEHEKEYAELAEWIPLTNLDAIELASSIDFRKYIRAVAETT